MMEAEINEGIKSLCNTSREITFYYSDKSALINKLNSIDKEKLNKLTNYYFSKSGTVVDLRKEVIKYLRDGNKLDEQKLEDFILKHRAEKERQFRAHNTPFSIFFPLITLFEHTSHKDFIEKFITEIKNRLQIQDKVNDRYFDFQGARQQGSDRFWLAIYNKSQESHSSGLQFFVSFQNGIVKYGIYRHSDQTYLKGAEERTASNFDFEALISMFEQNKELILQDKPKQEGLATIDLAGKRLFKMSHGSFKAKSKEDVREIFKQNNWIVLHETTKKGQAEQFKNGLKAGDLLYITVGGDELFAIASIKPGSWEYVPEDITNETGWIYREVEYLKSAIRTNPYELREKRKDIYPSGNSTLTEISPRDLSEANDILFRPYFGVEFIYDATTSVKHELELPNFPCNIILYGPPGTGKTFNTIDLAVDIVTGNRASHDENKEVFDSLREEGQIEFLTFHQNYGYEDFMIGIRPDLEDSDLKFRRTEGIFYRLCKRAEQNYLQSRGMIDALKPFDEVFSEFIEPLEKDNIEIEVKTVSGKSSFWITEINPDSNNIIYRNSAGNSYQLSIDTLQGLYNRTRELKLSENGRRFYFEALLNELWNRGKKATTKASLKRYVLIVDEINRANISKVFGELITLLEEDKRIGAKNELKVSIPNEERAFGVPPNLYLIGTMNTADKSIALIDIALRRRFEFIGYFPRYEMVENEDRRNLLKHINNEIYERKKSADYLIGHGYFMDCMDTPDVLRNKVIPLLMEYFSGKTEVVEDIFKDSGWPVKYDTEQYDWQI